MTRKRTLVTIQDATLKLAEAQLTFLAHDSLTCNSYPFYPTSSPRKRGFSKDSLAIWKTRLTPRPQHSIMENQAPLHLPMHVHSATRAKTDRLAALCGLTSEKIAMVGGEAG